MSHQSGRLVFDADYVAAEKRRVAVIPGGAAAAAKAQANAIMDPVVPPGLTQVATSVSHLRDGLCVALGTADNETARDLPQALKDANAMLVDGRMSVVDKIRELDFYLDSVSARVQAAQNRLG